MKKAQKINNSSNSKSTKGEIMPTISDHIIKRSFAPLLSRKDGSARLTFGGYKHSISKADTPFIKIVFSCMDITHENPANLAILASYRYSKLNKLGRVLEKMGFILPEQEIEIIDEDDEFGYRAKSENLAEKIYSFLTKQRGLVFKAKLEQEEGTAFYRVNIESIEPLMKGEKQVRDYQSDEGETPEIDMEDDLD